MHDLLVALIFLAIVATPAIVASIRRNDVEDDS
jgi:hypothetical protein